MGWLYWDRTDNGLVILGQRGLNDWLYWDIEDNELVILGQERTIGRMMGYYSGAEIMGCYTGTGRIK